MVCTWFGVLSYCSCLPLMPCLAWVLLSYVLQTLFLYLVQFKCKYSYAKFSGIQSFQDIYANTCRLDNGNFFVVILRKSMI